MDIAEATKTVFHEPEGINMVASRDGHFLSEEIATKVSEFVWTTIGEAFEYSNTHGESIPPEKSLFDFFLEKVQQTGFSEEEKKMCLDACKLWGAYVGDKIDRQSLKFFSLEECIDGSECCLLPSQRQWRINTCDSKLLCSWHLQAYSGACRQNGSLTRRYQTQHAHCAH